MTLKKAIIPFPQSLCLSYANLIEKQDLELSCLSDVTGETMCFVIMSILVCKGNLQGKMQAMPTPPPVPPSLRPRINSPFPYNKIIIPCSITSVFPIVFYFFPPITILFCFF